METSLQGEQRKDKEKHTRDALNRLVGEQVIRSLGEPPLLLKVQTRLLWESSYRVNIFVGADIGSAKVAHSFFLRADGDGNIVNSMPMITKRY